MMKKFVYLILFVCLGQTSFAQQLPLYSQYLYNKFLINPAHAGSDGFTSFNLTAREQWVGYSGSPRTYSFSFQTRFLKKGYSLRQNIFDQTTYRPKTSGKIGMGGYVFSDSHGLIMRTGFQGTYSYHFWVQDYTQLSFGLALTGYHFIIRANESKFEDPNEPWLNDNLRRGIFVPDADFGIYLLNPNFDVGFSAQQLFGAIAKLGEQAYTSYNMDRHYYLFGSYSFTQGANSELRPSVLLKMSEQLKPQADLGLTYVYDQSVWTGVSYRTGGAIVTNIGLRYITSRIYQTSLFFGYSFDFTLNEIQRATYGTHELTVALKFGDSSRKFRWLDRF
jgi:type IX secretion system PorP/SprF family membrane protein